MPTKPWWPIRVGFGIRVNTLAPRNLNGHSTHAALDSDGCSFYASWVFAARRQLSTENELYVAAVNALARRAHSVHEMKAMLGRRTEDEKLIHAVVDKLKEHRYLDDARYALEFTRTRVRIRRQGRFRIARELRNRGVPDAPIEAALDAVFAETDEAGLVRAKLQRMAKAKGPLDARKTASIYRSLLRAGFGGDVIQAEIRALGAGDVESDPDPAESSDPA
ncbi:MAG: regulatory protein RecX [Candidatus Acidiferrales bacterium]